MRDQGLWPDRLVADYLDDAAGENPNGIAIVDMNSVTGLTTQLTYAELQTYSRRIACGLASLGIEAGDVVAIQLPNWWHYAAVYTACVRIGAVVNPLMPICLLYTSDAADE